MSLRYKFFQNAKNVLGRRTNRKIVVFAVDDYGNVRIGSKRAREKLDQAGLKKYSRYDVHDTLETPDDFHALFEVLDSVKDCQGNKPIFTGLTIPANIDFESMVQHDFDKYRYELLPTTYQKLGAHYGDMMNLWKQGIECKLIFPEFHGREHFNVRILMDKLARRSEDVMACFANRSYTSLTPSNNKMKWTAAYAFETLAEIHQHRAAVADGLNCFEKIFGFRATVFNPPSSMDHHSLYWDLEQHGIRYVEKSSAFQKEHQGNQKYRYRINYTGKKNTRSPVMIVRNCVFEPTEQKSYDWVGYTLNQVETAFYWKKPAIISSHRVNFCGLVDEKNRETGLKQLGDLLNQLLKRWPDIEFMTLAEMGKALNLSSDQM